MNLLFPTFALIILLKYTIHASIWEGEDGISTYIDSELDRIVHSMSLTDKIGQMTQVPINNCISKNNSKEINEEIIRKYAQAGVGSYFNSLFSGGPVMNETGWNASDWKRIISQINQIYKQHSKILPSFAIDTIHGANYVKGATLFGQPLSVAASFNPGLIYEMGRISAKDTYLSGIQWIFSPVLGVAYRKSWPRIYETFGEDPYLVSKLGEAIIEGIQSSNRTAACMKHFIGYSNPTSSHDRSNSEISEYAMLNYFVPSFLSAVKAGVMTAMEAYSSINRIPTIMNHHILTDLLRHDMEFKGLLVTDDEELYFLHDFHHSARTYTDAVELSLNHTSVDMSMGSPIFMDSLKKLIKEKKISMKRLDQSVKRALELKKKLDLLPSTSSNSIDHKQLSEVGSKKDRQQALDLARESIILLKNIDHILPLKESNSLKLFVTGPSADNMGYMCGGWTIFWQGTSESSYFPYGKTIRQAIELIPNIQITYKQGVSIDGKYSDDEWKQAVSHANQSDYTIAVLGEKNYAEKYGDIDDPYLNKQQLDYLEYLSKHTSTKIILILVQGRPRLLKGITAYADAIIYASLPCEQGGQAIKEILFGEVNPSGRLPITYPNHINNLDYPYYREVDRICSYWKDCEVEWPFGHGLSYTEFSYENISISSKRIHKNESISISFTIYNKGLMDGKETILLFLTQTYRSMYTPETKLLKKFQKVFLKKETFQEYTFEFTSQDFSFYKPTIGKGLTSILEKGQFIISLKHDTRCVDAKGHLIKSPFCQVFEIV